MGTEETEDDGVPIEEKIARLTADIRRGLLRRADLQCEIEAVLATLVATSD